MELNTTYNTHGLLAYKNERQSPNFYIKDMFVSTDDQFAIKITKNVHVYKYRLKTANKLHLSKYTRKIFVKYFVCKHNSVNIRFGRPITYTSLICKQYKRIVIRQKMTKC